MTRTGAAGLDGYLRRVRDIVHAGVAPPAAVRSIAGTLLRANGVDAPERFTPEPDFAALQPPVSLASPWLLGQVHECLLDPATRRRAGAHYTPPAIARGLVALARDGHVAAPRVCDPAAGGGAFLLAAAESLAADGLSRSDVVRYHCFGGDIDDVAVDVGRATLALWAGEWPAALDDHLVVNDAFDPSPWPSDLDLVVGNPPFQGQLDRRTARSRAEAAALRERFGGAATGYVDTAALFLLRGLDLVGPGGRVALVQPHSTLGARDAAGVRVALGDRGRVAALWFTEESVFAAGVRVWAPVIERVAPTPHRGPTPHREPAPVRRRVGASFAPASPMAPSAAGEWTSLVADLAGIPLPELRTSGCVGDIATATAGFRDEYYGLVAAARERTSAADDRPRLITSGLVDVLHTDWGRVEARFANRRWQAPVVDVTALDGRVARWVDAQLVPKLVVATQTKVIEVAVDDEGILVPCTPVIAVHADRDHLWLLAAALASPPLSALALRLTYGSALSVGAIKLSARQVVALPLPADHDAWAEAARLAQKVPGTGGRARRDALEAFAAAGCAAYGVAAEDLVPWWIHRLPGNG